MKSFSAQYVFTNISSPLKRGIITTTDDGKILDIEDTGGKLPERRAVEFFDGIIVPGFINCHCHLELSHMKGMIPPGTGLGSFISRIRTDRDSVTESEIISSVKRADLEMQREGIVMCADICNSPVTFGIKQESNIVYKNLLEVFGIDQDKASKRISEIKKLAQIAENLNLHYSIVPHSTYSLSLPLFRLVKEMCKANKITSIHFLETAAERDFLEKSSGELMDSYIKSGLVSSVPETAGSSVNAILNEVTSSGNLILVHNTFADRETVSAVKKRNHTFWCLCPCSNMYISGHFPPADLFLKEGCDIVIGTDSLASNSRLSILEEIRMLQENHPSIPLGELIRWATWNGAAALNGLDVLGSIEPGKKPGLLLIQNADLINMRLLPGTTVKRLV